MDAQDQQPQDIISQQQTQIENNNKERRGKSRLSLIGLILAIIAPPIGLAVSIIALNKITKNNLSGKGTAIFGISWGATFALPFILFCLVWYLVDQRGPIINQAEEDVRPFITQIQNAGGKELCTNGHPGNGIDNVRPWYHVYYEMPDSPRLTDTIKENATEFGYPLVENTAFIKHLKGIIDEENSLSRSIDSAEFSPRSDYFISSKNGNTLTVTINRDTSVPLYCGVLEYGDKKATKNNSAIIDVKFTLPRREIEPNRS